MTGRPHNGALLLSRLVAQREEPLSFAHPHTACPCNDTTCLHLALLQCAVHIVTEDDHGRAALQRQWCAVEHNEVRLVAHLDPAQVARQAEHIRDIRGDGREGLVERQATSLRDAWCRTATL